ncbi:hypothetical protein GDO81_000571 [Engystomops pustulosus]|uniref:Uncharacterized protein n=1 Tax=Engystomops pustulosus TaxID=76066 RepID=A0AAV7D5B6_ENGPU|nr:hypothetical protein GDO81_000571 [Engystomops pustulosus]
MEENFINLAHLGKQIPVRNVTAILMEPWVAATLAAIQETTTRKSAKSSMIRTTAQSPWLEKMIQERLVHILWWAKSTAQYDQENCNIYSIYIYCIVTAVTTFHAIHCF